MTVRTVVYSLMVAAACFASPAAAYEEWHAATKAAKATTGDVFFRPTLIRFASGASLKLKHGGRISGLTAMQSGEPARIDLYRVILPGEAPLSRGNTLCGGPVKYFSVAKTDEGIFLSAYYEKPRHFLDGLCGGFQYLPKSPKGLDSRSSKAQGSS